MTVKYQHIVYLSCHCEPERSEGEAIFTKPIFIEIASAKNRPRNDTKLRNNAMTLIELLVAGILLGIVSVGIISVEFAIRRSKQSASNATRVAIQVTSAMKQMTMDAMRAIGDASNPGVEYFDGPGTPMHICFRYDNPLSPSPSNYSDDKWVCYVISTYTMIGERVTRCANLDAPIDRVIPESYEPCNPLNPIKILYIPLVSLDEVVTVKHIDNDINKGIEYIEFIVESRLDPYQAQHPITNPGYRLESRVRPPGLSH